ncbi:lipase family alpha/beta hydrolase [Alkalimarinus coralli]|uniref:lipase family alpha/beta hydrolase n=1 Tax=Alkalimarinus coralli TaxID=2935863 RepID=UPI00202B54DC|nr:triacylglycerol lipase [Alkalimarinus coralli]
MKLKSTLIVLTVSLLCLGQAQAGWFSWLFPPSTYTKTKYPIVMIGGFLAFDDILGIEYFYGIPKELREDGATVIPVNISAFNGTEARGFQLEKQLDELRAAKGYQKFNIMGHSGGATTARFLASIRPDLVASVTSVHGAHKGIELADWVDDFKDTVEEAGPVGEGVRDTLAGIVNTLGVAVEFLSGNSPDEFPQDALAMLEDYTTEKSVTFNVDHGQGIPLSSCGEGSYQVNGVSYYSWGGTSAFTNALDPLDYLFAVTSALYSESNDGLVGRCSSHLGKVIRDNYNMNHVDAMNHIFGLRGLFSPSPASIYRQQANRLKNAGL